MRFQVPFSYEHSLSTVSPTSQRSTVALCQIKIDWKHDNNSSILTRSSRHLIFSHQKPLNLILRESQGKKIQRKIDMLQQSQQGCKPKRTLKHPKTLSITLHNIVSHETKRLTNLTPFGRTSSSRWSPQRLVSLPTQDNISTKRSFVPLSASEHDCLCDNEPYIIKRTNRWQEAKSSSDMWPSYFRANANQTNTIITTQTQAYRLLENKQHKK